MSSTQVVGQTLTAIIENASKNKHKTGKGSRQRRTDAFRSAKNETTQDSILAGIYARLKITDPTTVSSAPLDTTTGPPSRGSYLCQDPTALCRQSLGHNGGYWHTTFRPVEHCKQQECVQKGYAHLG